MNKHLVLTAMVVALMTGAGLGSSAAVAQPSSHNSGGVVPYDRMGHFSCSFNERATRLERKNCGGARSR